MLGKTMISGSRNRIVSGRNDGCTCKQRVDGIEAASNFAHYADNALMMGAFQPRREIGEGSASLPVVVREAHRKPGEVESVVDEEGKDSDAEGRKEQVANIQQEEVGEKPVSMQDQLMEMFANTGDFRTAVLGMRLYRSCPLVRSADNRDLVWGRELGAGTHGRISLVFHDLGVFAIKELMETAGDRERLAAKREMKTIIGLGHHKNIIIVYAMDDEVSSMPILMEAAVSDFCTAIDTSRFKFHEEAKLLRGAACGLAYVHSRGKIHGDIKPSNIVLVRNYTRSNTTALTAKVVDFGFTLLLTEAEKTDLDRILWACPYDLYAMQALEDLVMERTIADGSFESVILATDKLRPDVFHQNMVCDLLRRCLAPTGTSRPTMKQVMQDLSFLCKK